MPRKRLGTDKKDLVQASPRNACDPSSSSNPCMEPTCKVLGFLEDGVG